MFDDFNFSFETGDFQDFETIGFARIRRAGIGITPTDGEFQALLTNRNGSVSDAELETFLELDSG
ncbi:MAG TPA: PEP-CTERM sorting domain-containing protein, partial [Xenococcaceae cyanobacterium]